MFLLRLRAVLRIALPVSVLVLLVLADLAVGPAFAQIPPAVVTIPPGVELPIATNPPLFTPTPTAMPRPTRPPVNTPTPLPTRPPRTTPTPLPTQSPRETPTPVPPVVGPTTTATAATGPTAIAPNPQPTQPTLPPDTQPTPTPEPPFVPGTNNRVEVTLFQCPAGFDSTVDESAFLATCPRVLQTSELFTAFGEIADDDNVGIFTWNDLDYMPGGTIHEEQDHPSPGYDIPYPDRPAVFCSEGDAAHVRIESNATGHIVPGFSELSNITYTCNWFKTQLPVTSLIVSMWSCAYDPPTGVSLAWLRNVCGPTLGLNPMSLADANGWRPGTLRNRSEWVWNDFDFGSSNEALVTIDLTSNGHRNAAIVSCDTALQEISWREPVFRVEQIGSVEWVRPRFCTVFGFREGYNPDGGLQAPNRFRAETWTCPAGFDPASTEYQFRTGCLEPRPGVEFAMKYPGSYSFVTQATTDANPARTEFGLMGVGRYVVVPQPMPGFQRVAFCWTSGAHGTWRRDEAAYLGHFSRWGWYEGCVWYFIPESATGRDVGAVERAIAMPVDVARSRNGSRRRSARWPNAGRRMVRCLPGNQCAHGVVNLAYAACPRGLSWRAFTEAFG